MKKLAILAAFAATPALADQTVELNFAAEIGGMPFSCAETFSGIGSSNADVFAADFRFYVTNASMISADGAATPIVLDQDIWQHDTVALLDFENGTANCVNGTEQTNTSLRGTVADGDYVGISFDVGVPFGMNHQDPTVAPSPLNLTSMFWNWRGGYKFVRIDMVPTDRVEEGPKGWFLHLGSTMCESASKTDAPAEACANPNHMTVRFDNFEPSSHTIIVDPAPVVAGADMRTNAPDTSPGCMSFPNDADCMTVMTNLGLPYMGVPASDQKLFSAR